jgi:hypothetical protein
MTRYEPDLQRDLADIVAFASVVLPSVRSAQAQEAPVASVR